MPGPLVVGELTGDPDTGIANGIISGEMTLRCLGQAPPLVCARDDERVFYQTPR